MVGRESTRANNLFYTCSLIDYIGRKTKNQGGNLNGFANLHFRQEGARETTA